jgi:membrane associated rhomboid family serine protease
MLPLKDDIPSQSIPFVTVLLIAVNVVVFLYQISLDLGGVPAASARGSMGPAEAFVYEFGAIPCRLTGSCPADFPDPLVTVLTSMFLHGGILHVGGNMLYLWIFGDNVEDTLGHGRFLTFYLVSGFAAAIAQTMVAPSSRVPMIGASGAVSGVLAAYLVLFPYARILTLIMFAFFWRLVYLPAVVVLGFWIVVQFFSGFLTLSVGHREAGGVAWFAHLGGFLAGLLLLFLLRPRQVGRL